MAKIRLSTKRLEIDKANSTMLIAVAIAAFVVVFSLVASKALLDQRAYQSKVIGQKKQALRQLKTNTEEVKKLETAYKEFASSQQNVLGGNAAGNGDKDGENPRIILDALPSKYDFPALTTSFEKLFGQYKLTAITGTDDEVTQGASQAAGIPQPVEMPFSITVDTAPQSMKQFLQLFELSIRPFQVDKVTMKGGADSFTITVNGKTYFQPEKTFSVRQEPVKK
jgi:hypothetical protein